MIRKRHSSWPTSQELWVIIIICGILLQKLSLQTLCWSILLYEMNLRYFAFPASIIHLSGNNIKKLLWKITLLSWSEFSWCNNSLLSCFFLTQDRSVIWFLTKIWIVYVKEGQEMDDCSCSYRNSPLVLVN